MLISIINRSKKISDEEVQKAIRSINRQIAEDFEPYWSFGATLRLEGSAGHVDKNRLTDLRGDAILYLSDKPDVEDALGYHETNWKGIPYGFVFVELAERLGESWTVTLSHEALELVGDAQANLVAQGPHPENPSHEVFHWFEMCDAVQSENYEIEGISVSNFVLPNYFTVTDEPGTRNDFLGRKDHNGKTLESFGVKPGGYIGFYDPVIKKSDQWSKPSDSKARKRMSIKSTVESGRSYLRKNSRATTSMEDRHHASLLRTSEQRIPTKKNTVSSFTNDRNSFSHIFVLMLENRSFDQMLGVLNKFIPIDGVDNTRSNLDQSGNPFNQSVGASDRLPEKDTDPGHEFDETRNQIDNGNMAGFVKNFENICKNRGVSDEIINRYKPQIMQYFDNLPILHTLARSFVVCDKWFSSLPGPTWPNRSFVHSGTSNGIVSMPEDLGDITDFSFYQQSTIYNKLASADIDWRIYHSGISQTILFPRLWKYLPSGHYSNFDNFERDLNKPINEIPNYVFIEPDFFGEDRTDQHPPGSVTAGERLIAKVYDAIRNKRELWNNSLLVVTWDEHGGFYDHARPGDTIAPDDRGKKEDFESLGVRVPALLISPRLKAGVSSTTFDHTSLLRYVSNRWGLQQMGLRAAEANSIEEAFIWADHLRGENETPADLLGKVESIVPDTPPELQSEQVGQNRHKMTGGKTDNLAAIDAHGNALLIALQAAAAQIRNQREPENLHRKSAAKAVSLSAKSPLTPDAGKKLFAELTGELSDPMLVARKKPTAKKLL